ncbi:MAG TPA: aspartyl protease family protein [Chthonomonadaceae bacterium]|nr:aspartyl protease family protein [Chthonomonadaceae bacterium]
MITSRRFILGAGAALGLCVALAYPARADSNADKLFNDDKYDQAKTAYSAAIKASPKLAAPRIGLIRTLFRLDDWSSAITEARAFVAATPQSADAHAMLSLALMRGGQPDEALKEADAAQKLNASGFWSLLAQGRALSWNYKDSDARADFKKASEMQPEIEESYLYWLHTYSEWEAADEHPIIDALRKLEEKKHPKKAPKDKEEADKRKADETKRKENDAKHQAYAESLVKDGIFLPSKPYSAEQIKDADEGKIPPISFSFPFERGVGEGGRDDIIIPMSVNGSRLKMLFDTGAGHAFTVSNFAAQRLNLPTLAKSLVGGVSGVEETQLHKADTLKIGPETWRNIPVESLKNPIGDEDGLIGGGVFEKYVVTVDFKENTMTLTRGKEAVAPAPMTGNRVIDIPFRYVKGYIFVRISVDNQPIWTMVDTGAQRWGGISLELARRLAKGRDQTSTIELHLRGRHGIGVSETSFTAMLFLFPVDIGCLVGDRTPYFVEMPDVIGEEGLDKISSEFDFNLAGLLGISYFGERAHRVSIDYPHRVISMELPE